MTNIVEFSKFVDNGSSKRERENFQNYLFDSFDTRGHEKPISFYRSDFRGAQIRDCYFVSNNFSNADYIDCYIKATVFEKCKFKSTEIYNSYFEDVNFSDFSFSSCSIVRILFDKVNFTNIGFHSNNIQETKFKNCLIKNCTFPKTTIDEVVFEDSTFVNADLSPMTAINIYFNNCLFENVIVDADYLGSYFFKENFLNTLKLKYRGRLVKLEIDKLELLANLFKLFLEKRRFYEAMNLVVQKNFIEKNASSIYPIVKFSIINLLKEENSLIRSYQLTRIFKLLEYYFNTGYIKLYDYFRTVGLIEGLDLSSFNISEQIDVISQNERIKNLLRLSVIDKNMTDNLGEKDLLLLNVTIDESDEEEFEDLLESILAKWTGVDVAKNNIYFIIGKRKGSLIYEIITLAGLGILLLNSFRKTLSSKKKNDQISGLKIKIATSVLERVDAQIKETHIIEDMKGLLEIAQLASSLDLNTFTNDKKTQQILSIIKSIQGQPTTLLD